VHAVETLEMMSGRGFDIGGCLRSREGEGVGPVHDVETLEMPLGRGPDVGGSHSSRQPDTSC